MRKTSGGWVGGWGWGDPPWARAARCVFQPQAASACNFGSRTCLHMRSILHPLLLLCNIHARFTAVGWAPIPPKCLLFRESCYRSSLVTHVWFNISHLHEVAPSDTSKDSEKGPRFKLIDKSVLWLKRFIELKLQKNVSLKATSGQTISSAHFELQNNRQKVCLEATVIRMAVCPPPIMLSLAQPPFFGGEGNRQLTLSREGGGLQQHRAGMTTMVP